MKKDDAKALARKWLPKFGGWRFKLIKHDVATGEDIRYPTVEVYSVSFTHHSGVSVYCDYVLSGDQQVHWYACLDMKDNSISCEAKSPVTAVARLIKELTGVRNKIKAFLGD